MNPFRNISTSAILFLVCNLSFAGILTNDNTSNSHTVVFNERIQEWIRAYNSKDARNLLPLYTDDATYTSSHVNGLEVTGRDKVLEYFQAGMSGGGHIDKIDIITMNVSRNLASLYCKYQATNSGVTVTGRNLLVLRKIKGKWLIINHMTVV